MGAKAFKLIRRAIIMDKRIAMYWHNGRALGHTSRSATLGKALLDTGSVVVGITGASRGLNLLPKGMDVLKIPSYLAYDGESGVTTNPIMSIRKSEFQHIRENLISTFVKDFIPDFLIVDYSPQGKKGELMPTLLNSRSTKKILGLRGVLNTKDESNEVFFNPDISSFIRQNYSAIHVYTDPNVFRLEEYYQVPPCLVEMIKYTGYVSRKTLLSKIESRASLGIDQNAQLIVANFGGGQGTEKIWLSLLQELLKQDNFFDLAYLASGPYMEDDAYNRVKELTSNKNNIIWTKFLDPLPVWMKASDLFIGSGGYNTLAEVISTDVNALIIPRQLYEKEQVIHCGILNQMNLIRVLPYEEIMTGSDFGEILRTCLSNPLKQHNGSICTDGDIQNVALLSEIC
jgi:predicted glycosyltransferase